MSTINNVGIPGIKELPSKSCTDKNCPFHGHIKLRGRSLSGKVVSTKMRGTIVFQRDYNFYIHKYQRFERRRSKLTAHVPGCMDIAVGDMVKVVECRKISKTVNFIVIEKIAGEEK